MFCRLWYLDHRGGPLDRGRPQGQVGEIQVEYVKEDIGKDENSGDDVDRSPEKGRRVGSAGTQHEYAPLL